MVTAGDDAGTLTQLMLENPKYYNYTETETAAVLSHQQTIVSIPNIFTLLMAGFAFDLFGRKIFLSISLLLGGLAMFMIPRGAPNITLYYLFAII